VELQGGTVHAASAGTGQGATFSIQFPMARIADKLDTKSPPAPLRALDRPGSTKRYFGLKDLRVLFIDDDQQTREAVREVLEHTGARIELAASAAAGRAALKTFNPQVILCDIAMPDEDGYAFIRKLRSLEATSPDHAAGIPALAFTALATEADRERGRAAGFQLHLAKPIDIDRLRDAVLQLSTLVVSASATRAQ
jgi:CheY-like chemotaxis protein